MRRAAAPLAILAIILAACSSGPATSYRARVTHQAVINPATLAVTVDVRNTSKVTGTPECTIQATDPGGSYTGTDLVTMQGKLRPGQTSTFVGDVAVSGQGAPYVTSVTVTCDEA